MIEKYITGQISVASKWKEQRILELDLINKSREIETKD